MDGDVTFMLRLLAAWTKGTSWSSETLTWGLFGFVKICSRLSFFSWVIIVMKGMHRVLMKMMNWWWWLLHWWCYVDSSCTTWPLYMYRTIWWWWWWWWCDVDSSCTYLTTIHVSHEKLKDARFYVPDEYHRVLQKQDDQMQNRVSSRLSHCHCLAEPTTLTL